MEGSDLFNALRELHNLARRKRSAPDPEAFRSLLARGLVKLVPGEQVWLLLPSVGSPRFESVVGSKGTLVLSLNTPLLARLQETKRYVDRQGLNALLRHGQMPLQEREAFEASEIQLLFPVFVQEEVRYVLSLGPRPGSIPYTLEQIASLGAFAEMTGAILALAQQQAQGQAWQQMDQQQTDFLSLIAHQLKTPLTSIKGALGLLAGIEPPASETYQGRLMASLSRGVETLETLAQEMLDFAQVRSGRIYLEFELTDLRELVRGAVLVVTPAIMAKGQELDLSRLEAVPLVLVDPARMEQVVLNLLNNANRYTPAGGRISLRLHVQEGSIVLSIEDTCGGLSLEDPMQILETPYRSGQKPPTTAASGSGLGLAITKGLMELHGGRLRVENVAGQGCTFLCTLPLRKGT